MGTSEGDAAAGGLPADLASSARRFLDMSIDLLGILDLDTTFLELSDSWERTFGWTRHDLLGTPLLTYFHEDDMPQIAVELATLLTGGDAVGVTVRIRTHDGTYRWVQGNARSDLVEGRIYVTGADITERKALEEALRRQVDLEERVATVTARLVASEADDVPAVVQQGMGDLARMMGADRAHFLRGRHEEVITALEWLDPAVPPRAQPPEADPDVRRWWLGVLRSGELLRLEDVEELGVTVPKVRDALHRQGIRSVLVLPIRPHRGCWGFLALVATRAPVAFNDDATALLRVAGESFLTAFARGDDAAALLDARRELEHRNAELERSNEDLERFAYSAAHDLKAPLARIEMALAATPSADDATNELLAIARRGANRMRQLIEDLLTFAAIGITGSEPGVVDLDDLVGQVLSDLQATVEAQEAQVEVAPLGSVWGHATLLGQLLQNLLANALKFGKEGVTQRITISAETDALGTTITVADNGIGIDPRHRDEVFGVFTRLHPDDQHAGSGIGLATCAKVVVSHGGQIHIDDGIDGGTAVVVRLPPRPEAAPAPE